MSSSAFAAYGTALPFLRRERGLPRAPERVRRAESRPRAGVRRQPQSVACRTRLGASPLATYNQIVGIIVFHRWVTLHPKSRGLQRAAFSNLRPDIEITVVGQWHFGMAALRLNVPFPEMLDDLFKRFSAYEPEGHFEPQIGCPRVAGGRIEREGYANAPVPFCVREHLGNWHLVNIELIHRDNVIGVKHDAVDIGACGQNLIGDAIPAEPGESVVA